MIEELSIEKLIEYKFPNETIDRFQKKVNYEYFFDRGYKKMFFASNNELKIYSGIDAARKFHIFQGNGVMTFPEYDLDLIPEYYEAKLSNVITAKKRIGGIIFDEEYWQNIFREDEIAWAKKEIEYTRNRDLSSYIAPEYRKWNNYDYLTELDNERIEKIELYLLWLNKISPSVNLEISHKTTCYPIAKQNTIETLEDIVINNTALNAVFKLLINEDLIDKDTKFYKDKTGGGKGHFYSTIILFNEKGYFKRQPNRNEYLNICNNTFRVDISESTARNHKTRSQSTLVVPPFSSND